MFNFSRLSRRSALSIFLAGCATAPPRGGADTESEGERLARVFHDSDEDMLRLTPQAATGRGDLRYADQFGDLITDDFQHAFEAYARRDLARIEAIDRAKLSTLEQLQYDVFKYQTEFAVHAYASGAAQINTQDFALDHMSGAQVSFPQFMAAGGGYPYATLADYENALKMHEGFVLFLSRAQTYMRRGLRRGNVHIRVVADRIIAQLRDAQEAGVEGSPFLTPTANFSDAIPAEARARLTEAFRASIAEKILPEYSRLREFFEREYAPAARTGAPGLAALPSGRTLYAYYLELFTTLRLSPDEIHEFGLCEVARIRGEMEQLKARVGFRGSLREFFTHIQSAPEFKFATEEAYLARFQAIWTRVREKLPLYFSTMPRGPLEIRPVPPEVAANTSASYMILGTADGARASVFYANTANLPTHTSPIMTALFVHEAQPGHHFQGQVAQENETLPAFLRYLWNSGYVEGWALYCERLAAEMGLYDDPYQYFGMLDMQMFRATRLAIDTGLHAKGWSREQAIEFMAENTSFTREFITPEIDRYIVTPGQATAYKLGERAIMNARARAEQALGARFDTRAFHEQVLNTGSLPLGVLDQKIDAWIMTSRA